MPFTFTGFFYKQKKIALPVDYILKCSTLRLNPEHPGRIWLSVCEFINNIQFNKMYKCSRNKQL